MGNFWSVLQPMLAISLLGFHKNLPNAWFGLIGWFFYELRGKG